MKNEFQNLIQNWIPASRYKVFHKYFRDRRMGFFYLGALIILTIPHGTPRPKTQILQTSIDIPVFHL